MTASHSDNWGIEAHIVHGWSDAAKMNREKQETSIATRT